MADENKVERANITRRFLDKATDPWSYVDQELPTVTKKIFIRTKMGTAIDNSLGDINVGSLHFSGSHYDFAPGSYSLRITRQDIGIGSPGGPGGQLWWKLRHSRMGTIDAIPLTGNARDRLVRQGAPMEPLYSLGPGTITAYMRSLKGTHRVSSSMEGVF